MKIDREYVPEQVESRWYDRWVEAGLFTPSPVPGARPFSMVLPPPNITGDLHMGHVLNHTVQDVVARWRRMQGREVLWLPGIDHAGIATQSVVERDLARQGLTRQELGRDAFEARIWEWKRAYGQRIVEALRRFGSSCDWTRERFTLDEAHSRAVRAVFIRLYREGLVFRDRRVVCWCPRCRTVLSDLETSRRPARGKLYTVRFPVAGGKGRGVVIATTRPETMPGVAAVAVHPDDERFRSLVGRQLVLPLAGRTLPVVADASLDPAVGAGAVTLTPGHDARAFAASQRLGLEPIVVIDSTGKMSAEAGAFAGLDRLQARKRIVQLLEDQGLLVDVKDHEYTVAYCQRCDSAIEPLLSTQWFVRMSPLSAPAASAIEQGRTVFVPPSWAETCTDWLRKADDWCISRQLWWGHRVPASYCDACGAVEVSEEEPPACARCGGALRHDDDVLDSWFSSALWPFTTLGWPERTPDLERYYPTSLVVTGCDIVFLWVARMMAMGLKFMDDVPFREVYIHGLVHDAQGQKMSKSRGNTVDPSGMRARYGTDVVRFAMVLLAAPGDDIPLSPDRMERCRAFANKFWNACGFVLAHLTDTREPSAHLPDDLSLTHRWILSKTNGLVEEVEVALEQCRFDRAADALYQFIWSQFCDWYLEFVKPDLVSDGTGADERGRGATARAVLAEVLDVLLRLLHPFMPFLTEELWQKLPHRGEYLTVASWPIKNEARLDLRAERDVEILQDLVVKARGLRADSNIDPSRRIELRLHPANPRNAKLLRDHSALIAGLVRASSVLVVDRIEDRMPAARGTARGVEMALPLEGLLDFEVERVRLAREMAKLEAEAAARARKLGNEAFLLRAPADVVEHERSLQKALLDRRKRIEEALSALRGGEAR